MARPSLSDRILHLLRDERVDVRCAAALVLGAAGKGDAAAGKALAAALGDESALVRRFVLDALESMGASGNLRLAGQLAPLLAAGDEETRLGAARLLEAQGASAERPLVAQLRSGMPSARRPAAALLGKLGTAGAVDALYEHLADPDLGEVVLQLLRAEIDRPHGDARGRRGVLARGAAAVKTLTQKSKKAKGLDAGDEARLAASLRLVGYGAEDAALPLLLAHARAGTPAPVRLAAIAGMRRILARPDAKGTLPALLTLIDIAGDIAGDAAGDADPAIARAAVDTLRGAYVPDKSAKIFAKKLQDLAKAKSPDARRLAAERLPALSGKGAIPTLLAQLSGADPGLRDAAARSLAAVPEASGPLVAALAAADRDVAVARRIAGVLRGHEGRVPPAALDALVTRAASLLAAKPEAPDLPMLPTLLEALQRLAPDRHATLLFDRATSLRKAGRTRDAFETLRPLASGAPRLDDDQRFFLGCLGLKASGQSLLRAARTVDPVLTQFRQLAIQGYPVAKQLAKQKDLDPEDLFNLGFNFAESDDPLESDLGHEILQLLIDKHPRSKLASAARNKLKLGA